MHLPRWLRWVIAAVAVLGLLGFVSWYKLLRAVPQPPFADEAERFKYGSIGAESARGLPFWIWEVLPRIFPDFLPGPGGYASFGIVWEPGHEIPVGFSKQTIGFPRIANNCAICHVGTWRTGPADLPHVVVGAPAHTSDVQGMIRFLTRCGADPRFNANTIMPEIEQDTHLSLIDRLLYRFVLIPLTRKALLQQARTTAWMNRPGWPDWGKGRDDPMNLTKYFMTSMPVDTSTGQADFPSLWNLQDRKGPGLFLNWSCDTPAVRSVLIDSALGLGAAPDATIPLAEIKTDPERMNTWTQAAADQANAKVLALGIVRPGLDKQDGYCSPPLDGIWMRAPYLHNGSVPTLSDLLLPDAERPKSFYRGYDVYDPVRVGFVTDGPAAERAGWKEDTAERGNGNQGHDYGTDLSADDRRALVEFMKTL